MAAPAIPITAPAVVSATISVTTGLTCGAGNATQAATVTAQGFGGNGSYQYNFNNEGFTANNIYVTNTAGLVDVIVRDGNGCSFTTAVSTTVAPLNPPTDMNISGTPIYCVQQGLGDVTSTVTVTTTNGVGALTYAILSPATATGNTSGATSGIFTLLAPDTYTFQVTDANGCTYQESYTVAPVTPIAIVGAVLNDISCDVTNGTTNNGSASFTVTGFSASGNYSITTSPVVPAAQISNVNDVITLTGLSAGTYTVTVTDNTTGCTEDDAVTITLPAPIVFTATPSKVFCSQDVSTITVSGVTGGTGTYTYAVVAGGAPAPAVGSYSTSSVLTVDTNLTALSWDVYVKDANGCIAIQNVSVVSDAAPTIVAPVAQCFVGTPIVINLAALATVPMGPEQYYTVNGSNQVSSTYTITAPGVYTFSVTDANGCPSNVVTYTVQPQLTLQANITQDLTCPNPASITLVPAGGTASYTLFEVDNGTGYVVTTNPFTTVIAGTYKFRVTDSQGCQAEISRCNRNTKYYANSYSCSYRCKLYWFFRRNNYLDAFRRKYSL